MNTITKTILAVVTAFSVATFAAEKVYMAPVGTTNIHSDYGIAAQKLMKTYIEDDGRFILVEGSAADSVVLEKQETVKAKAIEKGCEKYLIAEFTRLGDNVILSFKFYSTGSENPIWQDRLKAANPDDFDPIIQRVARTIGTNEKATNDEDIYNITENEARLPKRKKVNSYFGIGIGGMVPLAPEVEMAPGLNLFGLYDAQNFLFGIDCNLWGLGSDSRYSYADFGISAYYAFGRKFIAPYIGGGLSYSAVDYESEVSYINNREYYDYDLQDYRTKNEREYDTYIDDKSGIGVFVGGGLMLNRASNIVLLAEAKYFVNFYKLAEPNSEVTYEEWKDYDWYDKNLPAKSSKLFQGFMFNLKLGYGF